MTRLTAYPFNADRVGIDAGRMVVTGTNTAGAFTLGVQLSQPVNLSRPNMAALFEEAGPIWTGVTVQDGKAYCCRNNGGLVILDLADLGVPKVTAKIPLPGFAKCVAVQGDYACVAATSNGAQIVKLSTGSVIASVPNPPGTATSTYCTGLAVRGELLVMACSSVMQLVSISDPEHPVVVGQLGKNASGGFGALAIQGDLAYVASGPAGLSVVDISLPSNPVFVGSISEGGVVRKVVVDGDRAFCANQENLWVVDVSSPSAMATLEKWKSTDSVFDVGLVAHPTGKYLVAACGKAGIASFKV